MLTAINRVRASMITSAGQLHLLRQQPITAGSPGASLVNQKNCVLCAFLFWQSEIVIDRESHPQNSRSKLHPDNHSEKWAAWPPGGKLAVLRHQDFRRFYVGYATSLLGSAM